MKVLLLFEYASLNGGEHSLLSVLPLLQEGGIQFEAAAPQEGPLAESLAKLGIKISGFSATTSSGNRVPLAERREQLATLLRRLQVDLLHANSLSMARLSGPVAFQAGIASIGHLRDIVGLGKQAVHDVNQHGRLIAVSHATRDWHLSQGIDPTRTVVAYNGVDLDRFQPRSKGHWLRDKFQIPRNALLVGGVGQIGMRKGWDLLLTALPILPLATHDLHVAIAGERHSTKQEAIQYEQQLRLAAARSGLRGRVHFVGRVVDMPEFYTELDLLVHPARQEPLGRVLLEAAASGLPIIATDVGGTREIFTAAGDASTDPSAWIVEAESASALASALGEFLDNRHEARKRGERAREVIKARFSRAKAARELGEIYRDLSPSL